MPCQPFQILPVLRALSSVLLSPLTSKINPAILASSRLDDDVSSFLICFSAFHRRWIRSMSQPVQAHLEQLSSRNTSPTVEPVHHRSVLDQLLSYVLTAVHKTTSSSNDPKTDIENYFNSNFIDAGGNVDPSALDLVFLWVVIVVVDDDDDDRRPKSLTVLTEDDIWDIAYSDNSINVEAPSLTFDDDIRNRRQWLPFLPNSLNPLQPQSSVTSQRYLPAEWLRFYREYEYCMSRIYRSFSSRAESSSFLLDR